MATAPSAEARQAVIDRLIEIGQEFKIRFDEFSTETFSGGGYKAGKWTYQLNHQWLALNYWFSAFSNRKEEVKITYFDDASEEKLDADLRECLGRLRQFVKRKTSMF